MADVCKAEFLFTWGANSYGQLGLGHKDDMLLPQEVEGFLLKEKCIIKLTGGGGHSAVITGTGELFVCGQNNKGQLGLGHTEDVTSFTLCSALSGFHVTQVTCGWDFTVILTGDGQVLTFGANSFGQLGVPHQSGACSIPHKVESLTEKVMDIAAGLRHALAVTRNGCVFQWGTGMAAQAKRTSQGNPVPLFLSAKEPCTVKGLENVKVMRVASGSYHSVCLTDGGGLYVWGNNKYGQLVRRENFLSYPQCIEAQHFQGERIDAVWSGWTHLVARTETGKIFTWGRSDYGQLGRIAADEGAELESCRSQDTQRSQSSHTSLVQSLFGASQIACGSEHNLALVGGQCCSWGWNEHGMCGDGTETNAYLPKPIGHFHSKKLLLVGCGAGHSMVLCSTTEESQTVKTANH
ncbi:secretion-regulating guanine nucleotide exchange factor [Latimeria chalumnae]|uniref:Secretion regulating guanine nucleotide exchange factor n=1 Tax=Latimeria chalumnae TaxID=7897 RepID=H3AXG7_LATCH|nr:PREDICTED: secretion-regulating guanine nucleotide exchange factor [Latimeria chalumnae]|eukprot:XP_005990554.1 PREDICTED: secretion-regulating guanine nucleotide exchange factor [Latimeria chalumnae]